MKAIISKSIIKGAISAPPSKSYAHRMLICAALSNKLCKVNGISQSEDMKATLDCLSQIGYDYTFENNSCVFPGKCEKNLSPVFECRESGSTLRFMIPVAAALCNGGVFRGSERLIQRGIGVYENIFSEKNINVCYENGEIIINGRLSPGEYTLRGDVSSQYITGLLLALPLLDGDSRLTVIPPVESKSYIDITLDVLNKFGIEIRKENEFIYFIKGNQKYSSGEYNVEGDWSNAAFFQAYKSLGCDLSITNLKKDSVQGDKICTELFDKLDEKNCVTDISDCPDLGPVLFAVAGAKNGGIFTGTKRLRIKESDRAAAMSEELSKLSIKTEVEEDRVIVYPGTLAPPSEIINSHNDHRIVMAMTVLLSFTGGIIDGVQAVSKSYPDFFENMKSAGLEVQYEL